MSFNFRENIEQMTGYTPGFQPDDLSAIKINTNENPYPPSPKVFEAIASLDGEALRRYPSVYWDNFRKIAAKVHDVAPEMIVCGNGADELLTMLTRCCCDCLRPLAYPVRTYTLYRVLAAIQDCPVIEVPFDQNGHIPKKLYNTGASLTIICNPNAPTGSFVSVDEIAALAAKTDGVLAVDEAYVDFARDNCLSLVKDFDNVIILRSMSKGYSLAGMRFGYAIGSKRIVEAMIKVKDSYNVNAITQAAATAALSDQNYFKQNTKKIIDQRDRLTPELRKIGFDVPDSQTNFVLAQISDPPAKQIYEKLTEHNIYVRYFDKEGLEDRLRITVGTAEQMDALLVALKEIIS